MNIKSAVPNGLTLGNLLCGCLGIIAAFEANMVWASIFIAIAAVFDFFDGMVARLMGISGELGKQLDSLADAVTFGVLPGIMMYQWISISLGDYFTPFFDRSFTHQVLASTGLLVALFSALRLAIFNIDTRQSDVFIGVPTPANAVLIASFPLIMGVQYKLNFYTPVQSQEGRAALTELFYIQKFDFAVIHLLWNPYFHIVFAVISALLLVAPFPLLNFKFKSLRFSENKHRFIFMALIALLAVITFLPYIPAVRRAGFLYLDFTVVPIVILLYIIYSFILYLFKRSRS